MLTAGDDTCVITSASPLAGNVDALGQTPTTGADILKLDSTSAAFSFNISKVGGEFTNFETVQINGTAANAVTLSGTNSATVNWVNHGFVYGNATFVGGLANDGTLLPGVGAGNVGTMQITGAYSSAATYGHATMDVDLHVASNPGVSSDFIHVTGGAGGGTFINVNQINSGAAIKTLGNGILLWQVDGASTSNQFGLQNSVVGAGTPYQYVLNYVTDYSGVRDGVFLKSALRDEFYGNAALLSGEQAIIRSCFRSDQRIPDSPHSRDGVRMWAAGEYASFKTAAPSGILMDDKMDCLSGGLDFGAGDGIRFGVVGGYGSSKVNVSTPSTVAKLDGTTAAIEGLLSVGTPQYFFNVTAGYASTAWTFEDPGHGSRDATQSGLIGSAQAGSTINVTPFRFKFIAAVNYDHTSCGDNCLLAGTTESTGIIEAKGTIRVEAMTHQLNPYIAISYSDDLSNGSTVSMAGESLTANTGRSLLWLNGGFNAPLDEGMLIFGDFAVIDGMSNKTSGYSIAGGFKAFW